MLVRWVWKDCSYPLNSREVAHIDAFWVEATRKEAKACIFPHLSRDQILESMKFAEQNSEIASKLAKPPRNYCFLVARDLSMVVPLSVTFPFSNMWNAYSPFEEISERKISSLEELMLIAKRYVRKPRKCPACGSTRIAHTLYGMPAFSEELQQDMEAGKIKLGGCCIGGDDPVWQCADCDLEFYKIQQTAS